MEYLVPIFGILVVLVPITGLTAVLTAKYATQHIVDALVRLRASEPPARAPELEAQVRDLSQHVEILTAEVRRLRADQDVVAQLRAPQGSVESQSL